MPDTFSRSQRSKIMAAVKGKDTVPEMVVRKLVWRLGYRYRLHVRSLPGCPDLVFPSRRRVIFVHGCFWHRHSCSGGRSMPASRVAYWSAKFKRNKSRDIKNRRELVRLGWSVLTIWECEIRQPELVQLQIQAFFEGRLA
jgi:DNA mismatch endonuclease, patch repair protein